MTQTSEASDAIRREINRLKSLESAVSLLDKYSSFENATTEAEYAFADAQEKKTRAINDLAEVKQSIEKEKEVWQKNIEVLEFERDKTEQDIEKMLDTARNNAIRIIEEARSKIESELQLNRDEISKLEDERKKMKDEIQSLVSARDAVLTEKSAAEKALSDIKQNAAKLAG